MECVLPRSVVAVIVALRQGGYEAYVVGGSVRDLLLHRPSQDWDFTTNARPDQIQAVFPNSFYENEFGTVGVTESHLLEQFGVHALVAPESESEQTQPEVFEITTYRSEGAYEDFRRPSQVSWGTTLQGDLERRDFTINALALDIKPESLALLTLSTLATWPENISVQAEVIDPFGGRQDLQNGRIRSVGPAAQRFQEDALRMLRALRLAAQLQFSIEQDVLIALQQNAKLIEHVSWERIRDEFLKILLTEYIEEAFGLMHTVGLLQWILPELAAARGIQQRGHHEYDVWTHSLRACQFCSSQDPIVKFAALLHDIAKPETQQPLADQPGQFSFFNHEVIGARIARDVARRFCLSKEEVQKVFILVRWHMFHYQSDMTDAAIRRFIRRVGRENIDDMIALREGDRLGSGSKRTSWRLEEMKQRVHEQMHQPMQINEMAIDGHDVMSILGVKPGPIIGQVLQELFEQVLDDPTRNTREILLPQLEAYRDRLPSQVVQPQS